jgi:hypothetical protein
MERVRQWVPLRPGLRPRQWRDRPSWQVCVERPAERKPSWPRTKPRETVAVQVAVVVAVEEVVVVAAVVQL